MVFLITIISARRVSELQALVADPSYVTFHRDKVELRPDSEVVSEFHLSQLTCLIFP